MPENESAASLYPPAATAAEEQESHPLTPCQLLDWAREQLRRLDSLKYSDLYALMCMAQQEAAICGAHTVLGELKPPSPLAYQILAQDGSHRTETARRLSLIISWGLGRDQDGEAPLRSFVQDEPFILTAFQERLLNTLEGKAMTADNLESALKVDRKQLYRDGINPLRKHGLVDNNRRVGGYYRPNAPPAKYAEKLSRH
jgi:hypothetical protein